MQTEFTCGIYTARYGLTRFFAKWTILANNHTIAIVDSNGHLITFKDSIPFLLTVDDLIEITVLMNNIKRQYKQLQTI